MKKMKTEAQGRKCAFRDCNRTLSVFNHEAYCHLHRYQMSQEERIISSLHTGENNDLASQF
jgi:hypothetical protein